MMKRVVLLVGLLIMASTLISCSDDSTTEPENAAPVIATIAADPLMVELGATSVLTCAASDEDGDDLDYEWTATAGTISGADAAVVWTAPNTVGAYSATCTVSDGEESASKSIDIGVFEVLVPGTMVAVQGGTFSMGDSYDEGNVEERPVHTVTVDGFQIGKYEVTQAEWAIHMDDANYDFGTGTNHPVYGVSWFQIIKYCNLKSIAENLTPCYVIQGSTLPSDWPVPPIYADSPTFGVWDAVEWNWSADGYRLPTEAEWEYAARGGLDSADDYRYSGSGTIDAVAWYGDNAPTACKIVGGKLPNQLGLYDMSGNVYEFCWDRFADDYYTTCNDLGTVANPIGTAAGDMRVVRGGARSDAAANCRVAGRFRDYPVSGFSHTGFRLAKNA